MRATKRMMNALAAGAAVCVMGSAVEAATFTYTGPTASAVWGNGANWDLGTVPGAGDHVIITTNVTFSSYNGQSAGTIQALGTQLRFTGSGTFTMDNGAATAVINTGNGSNDRFFTDNMTLLFTSNLEIISGEMQTRTSITGPGTLRVAAPHFDGWKIQTGIISAQRIDVSGSSELAIHGDNANPDFTGQTIYLGNRPIRAHFSAELAPRFTLANIEMDSSYWFLRPNVAVFPNEHLTLASWRVGGTQIPVGTYNASSASIGDANFATLFGNSGASVTVVPEPGAIAGLAAGSLLMLRRRAKAR